jgi:hypothetical protein
MNPGELPYCEFEFDQSTHKISGVRVRNCADETDKDRAVKKHIEENRARLKTKSGLTNNERRRLHKEIDALERMFNLGRYSLVAEVNDARKEKKLKAQGKKLQWLARKADNQARSQK